MFTKDGISTTPDAMNEPRRATAFGTARRPEDAKSSALQPSNLLATLSHQVEPSGPPLIGPLALRRKESSTAFFSHWFTIQLPSAPFSATRALPESSMASASSTASRTSPFVSVDTLARSSQA